MKRLIIISFLIISIQALFGQMKSEAYFGVSGRTDNAKDILEMYDKGYLISAAFGQSDSFFGWNIKTDINLELLYDKVFEYFPSSIALDAAVCDDHGNVYVTGITIIDDEWPFISKIDSCGNYQWCKILIYEDEYNYGWSNDILLNENNEVVILVTLIDDEQPADQINMTHLIGLSDEGEVLWKKPYASRNDYSWIRQPQGNSIMEINNEYYITGKCYWPYPDDTTHWFLRPLFIGIDSTFEEKWILPFAPLDSVFGRAYKSIPLNDSVFLGAGIRKLPNSLDFSLLMFYTIDGEELGYNEILNEQIGPDINSNEIRNIERINDSLFITTSPFGPDFSENPMGELIIDTAANVFNIKSHPNTVSFIPGLIKTYDNNFVIASNIKESNPAKTDIYVYKIDENLNDVPFDPTPLTYDSLCPGGIQSGTIDLTSCFVWTDVSEAPSPGEYYSFIQTIPVKVFPNPVTEGSISFEFENTEHHGNMELRCFNLYGEVVHREKVFRYQEKSEVAISGWQKGMYFGVVYSGGKPAGQCKFVLQ